MAISTYAELKTAVANWIDRTDLSSRVPEWITLAESRINRDLGNLRMAWSNTTLTGSTSSRSLTLPSDFVEAGALFRTTDGNQNEMTTFVNGTMPLSTVSGTPEHWSINGANIDLDCPCDGAHTFLFRYRAKWQLSDSATTSWLLTNHPDVYLSSSLIEAYEFQRDDIGGARQEVKYKAAVDEILENEARSLAVAPLRVDPMLVPYQGRGVYTVSSTQ